MKAGKLVIVSGPSGSGKTTVVKQLLETCPRPLSLSVSATTRRPRPGELNGVDYHFLSENEFQERRKNHAFLECFEVFGKGWYGTLEQTVTSSLNEGKWVLLEIDVQGMQSVVKKYPDAITIFVRPASLQELERRLRGRGTETEESIQTRLQRAGQEWEFANSYNHDVINETVDRTVQTICDILVESGD